MSPNGSDSRAKPTAPEAPPRAPGLDGLRGIAAVVVLVHHCLLTVPALAAPYFGGTPQASAWPVVVAAWTPLHLVWAGGEAVTVFFVLSGFVLVLPLTRTRLDVVSYYPRRLLRLYGPVVPIALVGTLLAWLVPRGHGAEWGPWLASRGDPSPGGLLHDLSLVAGVSRVVSPLWSLQWEVWFSVLLPVFAVAALWVARSRVIGALAALALLGLIAFPVNLASQYLPVFALGSLLAAKHQAITRHVQRLPVGAAYGLAGVAALGLTSRWVLGASNAVVAAAAVTLVALAFARVEIARGLSIRAFRWLGAISFSLYLVHEPIVLAVAYLGGPSRPWWWVVIPVPIALGVAMAFYRWIERPIHRLSRDLGATLDRRRTKVE